ncbi:MAG: hypothetical protein HOM58_13385 [Rhodospirillaceae bacterium]|jgi:hypothetical protein|nr:hypothetical protein [Rhodospirillaceae bacterium]MBT5457834.1 hypothetical protein [Rhodospirillaceae bacterium]
MTPSTAILTGSGIIAIAIVAAAYVIPERLPNTATTNKAAATTPDQQPAAKRFQIVKVENGRTWRLDTQTGEITVCRLYQDRMLCAKSTDAAELPKAIPDQLKKEHQERRQAKREERNEMLDRFMSFFERIIKFAQKHAETEAPPPPDDGSTKQL